MAIADWWLNNITLKAVTSMTLFSRRLFSSDNRHGKAPQSQRRYSRRHGVYSEFRFVVFNIHYYYQANLHPKHWSKWCHASFNNTQNITLTSKHNFAIVLFLSHFLSTRSSDSSVLSVPYVRTSLGKRAFSVIILKLRNSDSPDTRISINILL